MTTATLSVPLDDRTAQALKLAPPGRREQLQMLISHLVRQYAESTPESLISLMDEIGREAQANGLTPEILQSILNDE